MASQTVRKRNLIIISRSLPAGENVDCEFNLPPAPVIYPARVADRCQPALFLDQPVNNRIINFLVSSPGQSCKIVEKVIKNPEKNMIAHFSPLDRMALRYP